MSQRRWEQHRATLARELVKHRLTCEQCRKATAPCEWYLALMKEYYIADRHAEQDKSLEGNHEH